jgi:cysteine-rich repeat protein
LGKKIIAISFNLISLLFLVVNTTLAKNEVANSEKLDEICNLYELTNKPLPLLCLNCGNGKLESSEQCDDGNHFDEDGCDSDCLIELPPKSISSFYLNLIFS